MSATEATVPYGYCHCGCGEKTPISPRNHTKSGYVKGEPYRFLSGHSKRVASPYVEEDRGYETPCWIWQLSVAQGYGRIKRDGRMHQAHRFYFEQQHGPLPRGHEIEVHHKCEVRLCVNPAHLEPLPVAHHRREHLPSTREVVEEIRRRYVPYVVTRRMLAAEFGLSIKQVTRIVAGQTWREGARPHV